MYKYYLRCINHLTYSCLYDISGTLFCYVILYFFMYTTGMVTANQIGTRPTSSKHLRPSSRPLEPIERKGTEFQRLIYMYMYMSVMGSNPT